jgi:hypothetical protein
MRQRLKQITPQPLWDAARQLYFGLRHAAQWPVASLHPWRRASIARLANYRDRHKGQRCFIIGNGPSLKHTDTSKLRSEFTFGMNRIYLAFPEWGFQTSYFVSINNLVIEQSAADIAALPIPKFVTWRARKWLALDQNTHFLHTTYTGPAFAQDVRGRVFEGATVTYVAMQLAFHMGFDEVILIGVDHSFTAAGSPNETVTSLGADADHFDERYFGTGFRWQLPDLATSEQAYRLARHAYASAGRHILDATIGGQLDVFPKIDYNALFD